MVRKYASFAFGLALIVALGVAMAHPRKVSRATGFSAPCEPASPALKAALELKAVSADSTFRVEENAEAPAGLLRRSRVEAVARTMPPAAPRAFPPLLHRPPPANA